MNLALFNWQGNPAKVRYACGTLDDTVSILRNNKADARALNCMGEFFRTKSDGISLQEKTGDFLDEAVVVRVTKHKKSAFEDTLHYDSWEIAPERTPDRQRYYQQVMDDPHAKKEDKAYALYRAIWCYGPSGNNACGGEDVTEATRKRWFSTLKSHYKGTLWERRLKYYW
ncbi:MAG: hypothetical protein LBK01_06715 [Burkholderiaceae bacterium]|nr:hypothetical protein [Burkholderiaceae bacterium]